MTPEAVHSVISEAVTSKPDGTLGGASQIGQRRGAAGGKNACPAHTEISRR